MIIRKPKKPKGPRSIPRAGGIVIREPVVDAMDNNFLREQEDQRMTGGSSCNTLIFNIRMILH